MKEYNLNRFIDAQKYSYDIALGEIKAGHKRGHWIWYIFPQLKELGRSYRAQTFGIENIDEARLYLQHPVLGARLIEISSALLQLSNNNPSSIMGGFPDDEKLRSCMTLFAKISAEGSVFHRVLEKFFDGVVDDKTIKLLNELYS